MKSNPVFFLALCSSFAAGPGLASTAEDVLRTAWKDQKYQQHQEAVAIAADAKSYNPLIKSELRISSFASGTQTYSNLEKADIRIDRSELTPRDTKWGVRLYPKGYTEFKTTLAFQRALEENEKAARTEALSKALASKYDLLARVALLKEKKEISAELSQVSRKANRALSYAAQKNRSELKSFIKTKSDLDKVDVKIADTDRDFSNLQSELKDAGFGPAESFDLADLAGIESIRNQLEKQGGISEQTTLSSKVAKKDFEKSMASLNYDRAQDSKWFDFVEVSMKDSRYERYYSFDVSFNLPFGSAPDLSRIEKEVGAFRDRVKLLETVDAAERTYKNSLLELKTLLTLHKAMESTQKRISAEQMKKASQAVSGQDPMLALELQRGWFESREQTLELEYRIRSLYIIYLHESAIIAENPEVNYLSASGKRIL